MYESEGTKEYEDSNVESFDSQEMVSDCSNEYEESDGDTCDESEAFDTESVDDDADDLDGMEDDDSSDILNADEDTGMDSNERDMRSESAAADELAKKENAENLEDELKKDTQVIEQKNKEQADAAKHIDTHNDYVNQMLQERRNERQRY